MLNSFKYMFKIENFWKKYLFLFCIVLVANLLINWSGTYPETDMGKTPILYYILFFAGFFTMFVPYGYSISLLKAKIDNCAENEFPEINIPKDFIAGLKVVISGLVLVLFLSFISFLIYFFNNILSGYFGEIIPVIFNIILFLVMFIVSFVGIAMCCRYVVKPSFLNFVNFKAAIELINNNVSKYFKAYILTALSMAIVYLIAISSVSVLTKIGYAGLVIYCILVSILWSYQIFVLAGLFSSAVVFEKN